MRLKTVCWTCRSFAYHEAGHAVVAFLYDVPIIHVRIPGEMGGYLPRRGECVCEEMPNVPKAKKIPSVKEIPDLVKKYVSVALAGRTAHDIYHGRRGEVLSRHEETVSRSDQAQVRRYLKRGGVAREDLKVEAYAVYGGVLAVLHEPYVWAAVEAVAEELLTKLSLTGRRIGQIIRRAVLAWWTTNSEGDLRGLPFCNRRSKP